MRKVAEVLSKSEGSIIDSVKDYFRGDDTISNAKEKLADDKWYVKGQQVLTNLGIASRFLNTKVSKIDNDKGIKVVGTYNVVVDFDNFDDFILDLENYRHKNLKGWTINSIVPGNSGVKLIVTGHDSKLDISIMEKSKGAVAYVVEEIFDTEED